MTTQKINSDSKPKEKKEFLDIVGDIALFLIGGILGYVFLTFLKVIPFIPG